MPVDITNIEFFDEYTGTGVTGTNFLMGSVLDVMTAWVDAEIYWQTLNTKLVASNSASSFTRSDNVKWIDQEFREGNTITVDNSASNDGNYTITGIDGNIIYVSPAPNNATDNAVNVYGRDTITNVDFYFNLIRNNDSDNFKSLVDRETIQKYGNDSALNPASGAGSVNLVAGTKSFGWVSGTGTITNMGLNGYRQKIRIKHTFKISPYFQFSQLAALTEGIYPPDPFADNDCLKYICRIDGRSVAHDPEVVHSSSSPLAKNVLFKIGNDGYFDEFLNGKEPEYTLDSISYAISGNPVDQIDFAQITDVTVILSSANGHFVNVGGGYVIGSPIVIGIFYCPLDEERYVNTTRTQDQNFLLDRVVMTVGGATENGEMFGTDYQSITDCDVTYNSANQVTVTFKVNYSTAIKTFFESVAESNRNYCIYATPQKITATTLLETDRNAVKCDVQNAAWDRDDSGISTLVNSQVLFYEFPDTTSNATTDVAGFMTDTPLSKFQLLIEQGAMLSDLTIQIMATDGTNEFELEKFAFNFTNLFGLDNIIEQGIYLSRGYQLDANDPRNIIVFERNAALDTATEFGYNISYPFKLRWEYWRELLEYYKAFQADHNQMWSIYTNYPAWDIKYVITRNVYDPVEDYTTEFVHTATISALDTSQSTNGNPITSAVTTRAGGQVLDGVILTDENTLVTVTFTGVGFDVLPAGKTGYYGILYLDIEGTGGVNFVDQVDSVNPARDDSVWDDTAALTVVSPTQITLSATLNKNMLDPTIKKYSIYWRLGYLA